MYYTDSGSCLGSHGEGVANDNKRSDQKNPELIDRKVIEDIKTEIEREADYHDAYVDTDVAKGMYLALQIIDKHLNTN